MVSSARFDSPFNQLSPEITANIFRHLNGSTLGRCTRVCSDWKIKINTWQHIWKSVFEADNGDFNPIGSSEEFINWKEAFKKQHLLKINFKLNQHVDFVISYKDRFSENSSLYLAGNTIFRGQQKGSARGPKPFFGKIYCHKADSGKLVNKIKRVPCVAANETEKFHQSLEFGTIFFRPIAKDFLLTYSFKEFAIWDAYSHECIFSKDNVRSMNRMGTDAENIYYYNFNNQIEIWNFITKKQISVVNMPIENGGFRVPDRIYLKGPLLVVLFQDSDKPRFFNFYDVTTGECTGKILTVGWIHHSDLCGHHLVYENCLNVNNWHLNIYSVIEKKIISDSFSNHMLYWEPDENFLYETEENSKTIRQRDLSNGQITVHYHSDETIEKFFVVEKRVIGISKCRYKLSTVLNLYFWEKVSGNLINKNILFNYLGKEVRYHICTLKHYVKDNILYLFQDLAPHCYNPKYRCDYGIDFWDLNQGTKIGSLPLSYQERENAAIVNGLIFSGVGETSKEMQKIHVFDYYSPKKIPRLI